MDKTSLTLGYLVGRRIAGQRTKQKTIIGYSFNGVVLPTLPEWDKETYPYAVIYGYGTGYAVTITDKPLKLYGFDDEGELFAAQDYSATNKVYTHYKTSYLNDGSSGWSEFPSYDLLVYGLYLRKYTTDEPNQIWSNHDILNEDGTLYLAASDPIPVYE